MKNTNNKQIILVISDGLYIHNIVHGHYFADKCLLYFNLFIHFIITFLIGGLESVDLDTIQIIIGLFIFFLLMYLNFQLFHYYFKEKYSRIFKNKLHNKENIFRLWIFSNLKYSLFLFALGLFYNKALMPASIYCISNTDTDFQLTLLLILFTTTPQILIICYFLNSTSLLEKFYLFSYLITLRWILIFIIILFVSGYKLDLSLFLLLLLSTGLLSIFSEIDIFINGSITIKTLISKYLNYFFNYIEVITHNYSKLICSYSDVLLARYKLIKYGHNSKIPYYFKKEIIDSDINIKVNKNNIFIVKINNIVSVTTRYVPSIIEFKTKGIIMSSIILEVINGNKKFCSYKLLGGASSSNSNFNSLIFPSEPLLSGNQTSPVNQTYSQYLIGGIASRIFSQKFVDLFFNEEYRPFNRYRNLIISDENKYILSLFAPLFQEEENNLFCFGVDILNCLVPVPYKKIFFNDNPNLSLYRLIGIFDNEADMIRVSDLYINQNNADHWVSGSGGKMWKSYSHREELENFPTYYSKKTFSSIEVKKIVNGRRVIYNPRINNHAERGLYLLIDGKFSLLPFESPSYFNVNTLDSFVGWKHGDKIRSFFMSSNSLNTPEK